MAAGTNTSSTKTTAPACWKKWAALRSELSIPGYWNSLTENCAQWASEVGVCGFWKDVEKHRKAWSNEFHQKTGGSLLAQDQLPQFCGKQWERIQTKIEQFTTGKGANNPKEYWPAEGPPVPRLNDLVRTRVVCQFLDGVEFMGNKLQELATEMGLRVTRERQGRLEGYFAQHLYFDHEVLFRFGGSPQQVTIKCEVQIATLLATRLWYESHGVYEEWRGQEETQEEWQWDPSDSRFIARQLGHMIHLADGLLVGLRDARSGERM
ncbi:MAG: hypothetical protein IH986_10015 [Planctomycetes bacterium]|nr:hypothetical protein [Planctomycetota bacterium]